LVKEKRKLLLAGSKLSGKVHRRFGALRVVQGKQAPTKGGGGQGELESNYHETW
jgi:hypothetical protein